MSHKTRDIQHHATQVKKEAHHTHSRGGMASANIAAFGNHRRKDRREDIVTIKNSMHKAKEKDLHHHSTVDRLEKLLAGR